MALNLLTIVEFGAQKQRLSLNPNSTYQEICDQIYSLFKVNSNRSKYILQRQDPHRPELYVNTDENTFLSDMKYQAMNNNKNSVYKTSNGVANRGKTWSTSSQCQHDESDRGSTTSATTIDIKKLIKKCLSNLKETTENIQLLDRCLHPEDYMDEDCQSTTKSLSDIQQPVVNLVNKINSQITQASSMLSNARLPSSNVIDELVPALNQLINNQTATSLSNNKPTETSTITPSSVINKQLQPSSPPPNVPLRVATKSFSNRLGMLSTPNHIQTSAVQEVKSTPTIQKSKSPVLFKPSPNSLPNKSPVESKANEIPPITTAIPKCTIELKQYEPDTTVEGIVSVASNASYFFLQVIDQNKDEFDRLSKSLHEYYSNLDKNVHFHPSPGDYCVAMYTEDARWYRARVIRYLSDQTCEVFYVDYGNMEELSIELVHEILPDFARIPARAIACTIAEILPPTGQEGWTKRATFAFASRCSNESVQATVVESINIKWPMHVVQLRVSKTKEDIGASLESCKVARRVPNAEIYEFWSNKIHLEQYILYNLQEPIPSRFPAYEQAPAKIEQNEGTNTLLSSSLERSPSTAKGSTREKTSIIEEKSDSIKAILIDDGQQDATEIPDNMEEELMESDSPITPSSVLNPDATPFTPELPEKIERLESVSTGDESDDENDSNATPVTSESSSERPRMPMKEEVIVDTNLTPSAPLIKSWLPVEITHIETPTRFYIRYVYGPSWNLGNGPTPQLMEKTELPEKNVLLKELTEQMTECYNKHKRICPGSSYDEGELVAVKSRLLWHRGRFIQHKPSIEFAHIFFVDYGYTRALPIQMIRPINNRFVLHAEQAHLVHLHQPGARRGRIEWDTNSIDEFRQLTKEGTYLYARIISEPNTIDLISYDPLTKKWFSFYEHFVKHLSDNGKTDE
ncbi:unnamed protein product [Adineta ricciae]|uniref:Tudor domain-containing protein n=1 Tax=Adineta ricciae TaxID=249248 RepID=A0A814GFA6_ADIRI|nr:unnamed protein product [Adineta ricciae]